MAFRFDIGDPKSKKTFHLEAEAESLNGMKIGETVKGESIKPELAGYEFEITGASDKAGFPYKKDVEGTNLKRIMLKKGFCLHKLKKRKKNSPRKRIGKGLKKRRAVRGNTISEDTMQINLKVLKEGKNTIAKILGKEEAPKNEEKAE